MTLRYALLTPALLLVGAAYAPAPVTTTYRLETRMEQIVDMSALGQGEQRNSLVQVALIRVTLNDSAGGKTMHVVVDSIAIIGVGAPSTASLDSLRGAWVHAFLDAEGRMSHASTSNEASDALAQLKTTLHTLHPRVKPAFKAGDKWSDTTSVDSKSSSQAMKSQIVTAYTAGGEETVAGMKARRLDVAFSSAGAGTVENPMAGTMELETKETGTGVQYVGADGRYLGGSSTGSGNAMVSSPMLPQPIPIKVDRKSTVTVIK